MQWHAHGSKGAAHLKPLVEDAPLPLDAHVFGPPDISVQVMLWWWYTTDACTMQPLSVWHYYNRLNFPQQLFLSDKT